MTFIKDLLTPSFLFLIFATAIPTLGCSYYRYPNPPLEYVVSRTETIFLGTVIQKTYRKTKVDRDKYRVHSLLFRIDRSLKGQTGGTYKIEYHEKLNPSSCDDSPPEPNRISNVRHPEFLSGRFNGDDAKYIDRILRAVKEPRTSFYGQVEAWGDFTVIDPSKITIELRTKDGRDLLATTAIENEHFSFADLSQGDYLIRLRSSSRRGIYIDSVAIVPFTPSEGTYKYDYPITMSKSEPSFADFVLTD